MDIWLTLILGGGALLAVVFLVIFSDGRSDAFNEIEKAIDSQEKNRS